MPYWWTQPSLRVRFAEPHTISAEKSGVPDDIHSASGTPHHPGTLLPNQVDGWIGGELNLHWDI